MHDSKAALPENADSGASFTTIVKICRANIRFIASMTILGAVLVAAYSLIMPQTYTAVGTLMPPENKQGGGLSSLLQSATSGLGLDGLPTGGKSSLTFVDILKSRSVARMVAGLCDIHAYRDFGEMTEQAQWHALRSMITIKANSNGLVIGTAEAKTPYFPSGEEKQAAADMAAKLVNAAFTALDSINRAKSVSAARQSRRYIERYISINKLRLDSVQNELENFSRENKVLGLEEQTLAIVENAVKVGAQLAETELELEIAELQLQKNTPYIQQLEREVELLKDQYRKIQEGGITDNDLFSIPLKKVPSLMRRYTNLLRDIKILEQINAYLETRRAQEAIQEHKDVATVQVLDDALPPEKRTSPRRFLMTSFSAVILFLTACGIVLFRHMRKQAGNREIDLT